MSEQQYLDGDRHWEEMKEGLLNLRTMRQKIKDDANKKSDTKKKG